MSTQLRFLVTALLVLCSVPLCVGIFQGGQSGDRAEVAVSQLRLEDIPFDGERAYEYLKQLCAIGPRPSGSAGMEAQQ